MIFLKIDSIEFLKLLHLRQRYLFAVSLLADYIKALLIVNVATNRVDHAWRIVLIDRLKGSVFVGLKEFYNVCLGSDSESLGAVEAELSDGAIRYFDFVENLVGNARINR